MCGGYVRRTEKKDKKLSGKRGSGENSRSEYVQVETRKIQKSPIIVIKGPMGRGVGTLGGGKNKRWLKC